MRKIILLTAVLLIMVLSSSAYAVDCWNSSEISQRVHRLDVAAQRFQQSLYDVRGYDQIADGVEELSISARHLHRISERPSSCEHIVEDFEQVEQNYERVRRLLQRADERRQIPRVLRGWESVRDAYLDTRGAVYASLESAPSSRDPHRDGVRSFREDLRQFEGLFK